SGAGAYAVAARAGVGVEKAGGDELYHRGESPIAGRGERPGERGEVGGGDGEADGGGGGLMRRTGLSRRAHALAASRCRGDALEQLVVAEAAGKSPGGCAAEGAVA